MAVDLVPAGRVPLAYQPHRNVEPTNLAEEDLHTDEEQDAQDEIERKRQIVEDGLAFFRLVASAESKQRTQELDDLRFDRGLPEDQWAQKTLDDRAGGDQPDGTTIPPRPTLTIPKQDQPVQQIIQETRSARYSVVVKPGPGKGASVDGAALRQELYRAIEVDSRAQIARMWALDRAVKCGRGAYRVLKEYVNDGDPGIHGEAILDQKLVIKGILNQHSVYLDPFAKEPDWSDGSKALITSDLPVSVYRRYYKTSKIASMSADQLSTLGDTVPGWVGGDDEKSRTIRVAEFFYIVYHKRTVVLFVSGSVDPQTGQPLPMAAYLDDVPEAWDDCIEDYRDVEQPDVKWCVFNAMEVLDEEDWDGKYIPIIPVIGKQYVVDNQRSWQGVITKSKDAQRSYNFFRSEQQIAAGLASKAQWILAEGQDEGYEEQWDEANTRYFTRLKYKPTEFEGHLVTPPHKDATGPDISAYVLLAREADNDIKATTGRFDPSLGQLSGRERSGKAIRELKVQGEQTSGIYGDNLAQISMAYEAKVILDLFPHVYNRPGRIEKVLGEENKERSVMLNQPFRLGPNKEPLALRPNEPFNPDQHKHYDFTGPGTYGAVIEVGKQYQNQLEQDADLMSAVAEAAPQLVPLFADIWVEASGTPTARRIAKRIRDANPKLKDDEESGQTTIPPQVQAQLQAGQQQLQEAMGVVQQLQEVIKTEQVKSQREMQIEQMKIASAERIALQKIKADLVIEQAKLDTTKAMAILDAAAARLDQESAQAHERHLAGADASTAIRQQLLAHAGTLVGQATDHAQEHATIDHAAAVAPPPVEAAAPVAEGA